MLIFLAKMAMSTPIKKPQFATEEQKNKNRDRACELLAKLRMENPYRFETMAKMYISIYAVSDLKRYNGLCVYLDVGD